MVMLKSSENDRLFQENNNLLAEFRVSSIEATMIAKNLSVNEIEEAFTVEKFHPQLQGIDFVKNYRILKFGYQVAR